MNILNQVFQKQDSEKNMYEFASSGPHKVEGSSSGNAAGVSNNNTNNSGVESKGLATGSASHDKAFVSNPGSIESVHAE